jgi:hypothetical protein
MIATLLVFISLGIAAALALVFVQPWFDIRDVDWNGIAEDFHAGYRGQHDEADQ